MIKITTVHIKNFLSVEDVTVDFSRLGLCLVKGENGSGKSTIYRKAVEYLLFGAVPEKLKADDFLSDFNKKDSCVFGTIYLETPTSTEVVDIWRYRNSKDNGNSLIVKVNGKDVSKTDNRETQKVINEIIGVDFDTFESSTCFNSKAVLFAESGAAGRAALMSKILNLDVYEKAYKKVQNELSEIESSISELSVEKRMIEESLQKDRQRLESIEKERADNSNESKIESLKKKIDVLKSKVGGEDDLSSRNKVLKEEEKEVKRKMEELIQRGNAYDKELSALSSVISHIKREVKKIKADSICSSCKQNISVEHVREQHEKAYAEILEKSSEYDDLRLKKEIVGKEIRSISNNLNTVSKDIRSIENEMAELSNLKNDLKLYNTELVFLEEFELKSKHAIEEVVKSIKESETKLESIEVGVRSKEYDIKMLRFWKEGFSRKGIPNLLIDKSLGRLQVDTNNYLSSSGLEVELSSQRELKSKEKREEIGITVYNNGNKRSYDNLSAGEKKRVDIAFMFAIMDLSTNKFNISIMDEVFDSSLDSAGEELVFDILKDRRKELDSIIVISHQSNLQDLFDNVVTVVKKEDKSNVVRGRIGEIEERREDS